MRKTTLAIVDFEYDRDYELRNVDKCFKTEKYNGLNSPLEPPEKNAAMVTLRFYLIETHIKLLSCRNID